MKKHIDCYGRECKHCGKYKTWDNYYKEPSSKIGFRAICKLCDIVRVKKYKTPTKPRKFNDIKLEGFSQIKQDFYLCIKKAG
jgi:hypothetical protein